MSLLNNFSSRLERICKRIPDPIVIFIAFYPMAFLLTMFMAGYSFETMGSDGASVKHAIKGMHETANIRWIFDNALLDNWLGFGNGVLGVILVVMIAVGIAERSGLFGTLIKLAGAHIPQKLLPLLLVFIGILSSMATDAGYLVLIPLAGLLYAGLNRNPIIGMAAAFAGVSAGFSANLIPGPIDAIIGMNAQIFAESQGVPFTDASGEKLNPISMHWTFIVVSTFVLSTTGHWITRRFVEPRLNEQSFEIPEDINPGDFTLHTNEHRGLRASAIGALIGGGIIAALAFGPLSSYSENGKEIRPFMDNLILLISFFFAITGIFYGVAARKFKKLWDIVEAMVQQMNTMGYILVLTFFTFNFLALLSYSGMGTWITYLGAEFLQVLGLQNSPILLLIGFILITAVINIFIGGMTAKWMLLGPVFIPMLYFVNPEMTPEYVAAAFRVADSSTNIISPMMAYAGVILAFMRKYRPNMVYGEMLVVMIPYSLAFLLVWTGLLIAFFLMKIPLGF